MCTHTCAQDVARLICSFCTAFGLGDYSDTPSFISTAGENYGMRIRLILHSLEALCDVHSEFLGVEFEFNGVNFDSNVLYQSNIVTLSESSFDSTAFKFDSPLE